MSANKPKTRSQSVAENSVNQNSSAKAEIMEKKIFGAIKELGDQFKKSQGTIDQTALNLMQTLSNTVEMLQSDVNSMKSDFKVQEEEMARLKKENQNLMYRQSISESRIQRLEHTVSKQKDAIIDLKSRSMRDNLVFYQIPEETDEQPQKTKEILYEFLEKEMNIADAKKTITFDRVHRMGGKKPNQPRPIVVKCNPYTGKEKILKNRSSLDEKDYGVSEQFPPEVDETRRELKRIIKSKKEANPNVRCKIVHTKLYVNDELHEASKPEKFIFSADDIAHSEDIELVHSDDIHDQGSTFAAHGAVISSRDEVKPVLLKALEDRRVAGATHNMYAYRFKDNQGNIREGHNDDGEHGAGWKILEVLREKNAEDSMIVCTRWYGGKHLGPDRFKRIKEVSEDALSKLSDWH